ncbi:MBL fold metallo-hydrolase [Novosphingobium sp. KACC 22771]|uniref:MBL fold metallo-hydrolase n=1 Tax=Novosphingobium sp. KACC 22771 TaxID=3025670 RepID=UPI002365387C|nr:MBL fold metallo-hydrolase [Novosphingobium sp. KACC 22771]WDF74683.1 MBL fold metallo-hydrolase [Novosphingobium sp. KACC 22771]
MERPLYRSIAMIATLCAGGAAVAQMPSPPPAGPAAYPAQAVYPKENREAVGRELAAARKIAGADLEAEFNWRCLISPLDRNLVMGVQHDGLVPATRVFDNLYSIGQNSVSAWAIDTPQGIIVIDALNSPDEARDILVPNMQKLGLDPKRIKYVIVTHGHGDHWGGAKFLQDTYGARIVASATDWAMMESPSRGGGPFASLVPPRHDIEARDGDSVTLGDYAVKTYITPGHTPGTLSLVFPVFDQGVRHNAGLMGGTGGGSTAPAARQQIASLARWQGITKAAGVDVLVTNHPVHMAATEKEALIRYGATGGANPFIYGVDKYQRYMGVMSACSRVQLARMGEAAE